MKPARSVPPQGGGEVVLQWLADRRHAQGVVDGVAGQVDRAAEGGDEFRGAAAADAGGVQFQAQGAVFDGQ